MGFFNKKRSDGVYVKSREAYSMLMPFIMPKRTESLVYYETSVDIANVRAYLHKRRREGETLSFFSLIIAAVVQTFVKYPRINRFVAGKRLYQRNDIEICYTVKREMSENGDESTAKIRFKPGGSISQVAAQMENEISGKKEGAEGTDDKLVKLLAHAPRFAVTAFAAFIRWLDFNGMLPKSLQDELPFWCSLFVSNMGSLGMSAPLHHLYEIGTCSLFMTIGRMEKYVSVQEDGSRKSNIQITLGITVDERIVDGFYFSRAASYFGSLLKNPEQIDTDAKAAAK